MGSFSHISVFVVIFSFESLLPQAFNVINTVAAINSLFNNLIIVNAYYLRLLPVIVSYFKALIVQIDLFAVDDIETSFKVLQ